MSAGVRILPEASAAALRRAAEAIAEEFALRERFLVVSAGDLVAIFQDLDVERARVAEITKMLHAEGIRLQKVQGELVKARRALYDARKWIVDEDGEENPVAVSIDAILGERPVP